VAGVYQTKRVLITARTYPTPSSKDIEVSCTAGITDQGQWIRLYPIRYRFLDNDQRFRKYQWIEAQVTKSSDHRPESYKINPDSIQILSPPIKPDNKWQLRKNVVYSLQAPSLCYLQHAQPQTRASLGFFKPREIMSLEIQPESNPNWTEEDLAKLERADLFQGRPAQPLEKVPYKFYYHFTCDEAGCAGHRLSCVDWEMGEAWRGWQPKYGPAWEAKFREKFEHEMIDLNDTRFFVGTVKAHPNNWIIIGLFYPRK